MIRIKELDSLQLHNTIVMLGKFDGFHLGHQRLLETALRCKEDYAVSHADREGLKVVIFTFDIHPACILGAGISGSVSGSFGDFSRKSLCAAATIQTREERFFDPIPDKVDYIVEFPFNKKTMSMEPEQFVKEILVEKLGVRIIVCGPDFRFGRNRRGNVEMLKELGLSCGFDVKVVPKVMIWFNNDNDSFFAGSNFCTDECQISKNDSERGCRSDKKDGPDEQCGNARTEELEISSTLIKEEIGAGRMELAAAMLGRPFSISGEVVHGKHLGNTIGFPTANLRVPENKILPPDGVYATRTIIYGYDHCMEAPSPASEVENRVYPGITNIGRRPTFQDGDQRTVETYLFDFDQDLYGNRVTVEFLHYLRPEKKFSGVEELTEQMRKDECEGRKFYGLS